MFRTLLVPLDTSPFAEQAVARAVAIARSSKADMHLVLVHAPMPLVVEGGQAVDERLWAQEGEYLNRYMKRAAADLKGRFGLSVNATLLNGPVLESITAYAREHNVDLIVMATHGRTGLSRAWLGSVADGLMRQATVPVLMVRSKEAAARERHPPSHEAFGRILVPLDGSETAESITEYACALGTGSDASYLLVQVVRPVPMLVAGDMDPSAIAIVSDAEATKRVADDAEAYLTRVAGRLKDDGATKVATQVAVAPNVASAIVELARTHHADLVAMTSHGRGASRLLVGSVADKVLRGTDCAVLLYRPRAAVRPAVNPVERRKHGLPRLLPS